MKKRQKKQFPFSIYLMLFVIGTVIAVSIILTTSFYQVFQESLLSVAKTNTEQSIAQVSNAVENYSGTLKHNMEKIVNTVINAKTTQTIKEYTQTMVDLSEDIVSIVIYDENGKILNYQGKYVLKDEIENNLSFTQQYDENSTDYNISAPHIQNIFKETYPWVVTASQKKWSDCYDREVFITMDIRFSAMASYIDNVGIGQHGYCFITNSHKDIVYHPLQQLLYLDIKQEDSNFIDTLQTGSVINNGIIYTVSDVPNFNWRIIGVSYVSELVDAKVLTAIENIVVILIFIIMIASGLVFLLTRKITNPVRSLVKAMNEFENNAIDYKYSSVQGVKEFNQLSHSFDHMVGQIQYLMEKVKQEEVTLRKTELKALQAQINPHFLYNTLDSIQWMCEREKTQDAVRMVSALGQLFRISISKGYELIPIEKEIQHAKNYLVIQSYRYKDQFTYSFDIDPEVMPYFCNKITLQPIIENALYHGVSGNIDEGRIVIKAYKDNDSIVFSISDNGVGMTEEQVSSILHKELTDSKGIGVKNVNDRIQIYFGEEYGIVVESKLDVGTMITIRIPATKEEYYGF